MDWSIFTGNILIHVGMMALFLTIFFFTVAQYFEKKIVEDQINFVIKDFIGNSLKPISPETKTKIKQQVKDIFNKIDLSKEDKSVEEQNAKIKAKAWKFVGILVGIIAGIVIIFGFIFKWNPYYLKYLFNSAFFSLIFVAIAETLFLFLIAQNYLSADPSKIKLSIINTLVNNRCSSKSEDSSCIGKL
jgi:hypothetical protein